MQSRPYLFVKSFLDKLAKDKLYNYSANAAFFLILSIFPSLILLLTMVHYTPLTEGFLIEQMQKFLPEAIYPLMVQIVEEIYSTTYGGAVISVSALAAIWSASKGVLSLIRGTNVAFNINDRRNYFRVRLLSCFYTFVIIVLFTFLLITMVFGKTLYGSLKDQQSFLYDVLKFLLQRRVIVSLIVMTFIFMLIYKFMPAKQNKFWQMFPGSILCAASWVVLSQLATIYIKKFPNFTYTYGSLTSFVLFMLLLYFYMYVLFICAEINFFFKSWVEMRKKKSQVQKAVKYLEKQENKKEKQENKKEKHETKRIMKEEKAEIKREIKHYDSSMISKYEPEENAVEKDSYSSHDGFDENYKDIYEKYYGEESKKNYEDYYEDDKDR